MILHRLAAFAATTALGAGLLATAATPASAAPQCSSNFNLWHVHRRLDGAIDQLQHDDRDYDGYRARAVRDLVAARRQLFAAERFASSQYGDPAACFQAYGNPGGDPFPGLRGQGGSNHNVGGVDGWIGNLEAQLQSDNRDYGGHKDAAIADLQRAQANLGAANRYAYNHGY